MESGFAGESEQIKTAKKNQEDLWRRVRLNGDSKESGEWLPVFVFWREAKSEQRRFCKLVEYTGVKSRWRRRGKSDAGGN